MINKSDVIIALKQCTLQQSDDEYETQCTDCPYYDSNLSVEKCRNRFISDATQLINPTPVKAIIEKAVYDQGCWWYVCGRCKKPIDITDKFCRHCGTPVKVEENINEH